MTQHMFAIVGNPNCGKTTVYNALTGARQRVGNWPGVTVEKRSGNYRYKDSSVEVVDLPGTYCLDVVDEHVSMDERIARDFILSREAQLILNVIDASNIERNLFLSAQLLDMGLPVVVVLNMMDVAEEKGMKIHPEKLAEELGCPVHCIVASKERGVQELKEALDGYFKQGLSAPKPLHLGDAFETAVAELETEVKDQISDPSASRWVTIKLIEGEYRERIPVSQQIIDAGVKARRMLENQIGIDMDIMVAGGRYDKINATMKTVVSQRGAVSHKVSDNIDRVVLNRVLGLPIFFGVMYLMFVFSVNIGSAFIDFFDILFGAIFVGGVGHLLDSIGSPEWLTALLAEGVGGGIQTVSTFIPVIAFLFLFLSMLEDSGYMARAAFVMDRLMRYLGLPGKAFVPMLVGFGCSVPAIMASRTLDSQQDRMLTISMAPFMSCGARLPVYALFAAAFFPRSGQNVVFTLYLVGILAAVFTGLILKKFLFKGEVSPSVMELPNYHLPSIKQVLLSTWDRLKAFMFRAGKAIVIVVVVLNTLNSVGTDGSFGNQNTDSSVLSKIGQTITPAFAPMGMEHDNWPAAVGIFTGILAKEAVVGTLDAMYTAVAHEVSGNEVMEHDFNFTASLKEAWATVPENLSGIAGALKDPLGIGVGDLEDFQAVAEDQSIDVTTFDVMRHMFSSEASVIAYLLLILLYTPCVAALGAIYREAGTGWMLFVAGWTFVVGYSVATLYYQVSVITMHPASAAGWIVAIIMLMSLCFMLIKRAGVKLMQSSLQTPVAPSSKCCTSGGCH